MEKDLIKILNGLKSIEPDLDYTKKSRFLILASKPTSIEFEPKLKFADIFTIINGPRLIAVGAGVIILALVAFGGISIFSPANQRNLIVEANERNVQIQIKINDIKYIIENTPSTDTSKIIEAQSLLVESTKILENASKLTGEEKIEESLNKLKEAQELLNKLEGLIK